MFTPAPFVFRHVIIGSDSWSQLGVLVLLTVSSVFIWINYSKSCPEGADCQYYGTSDMVLFVDHFVGTFRIGSFGYHHHRSVHSSNAPVPSYVHAVQRCSHSISRYIGPSPLLPLLLLLLLLLMDSITCQDEFNTVKKHAFIYIVIGLLLCHIFSRGNAAIMLLSYYYYIEILPLYLRTIWKPRCMFANQS